MTISEGLALAERRRMQAYWATMALFRVHRQFSPVTDRSRFEWSLEVMNASSRDYDQWSRVRLNLLTRLGDA